MSGIRRGGKLFPKDYSKFSLEKKTVMQRPFLIIGSADTRGHQSLVIQSVYLLLLISCL